MKDIIFLSYVLDDKTPTYADKNKIVLSQMRSIKEKDTCNEMSWSFTNHIGTHIDAPRHFIEKGKTIDQYLAEEWIFESIALVCLDNVHAGAMIMPDALPCLSKKTQLLLIKTGFERYRGHRSYWENSPGLHPNLAGWLKKQCPKIRAVGMDIISVSSLQHRELGRAAHNEFLGREILLIEDMRLSDLKTVPQRILIAPLRVQDSDASPCSVFAWRKICD